MDSRDFSNRARGETSRFALLLSSMLLLGLLFGGISHVHPAIARVTLSNQSLVVEDLDWQPQDYIDSQGIKAVRFEDGRLVLDAHLVGNHSNYEKGEVFLDLKFVVGLEDKLPFNLNQSTITAEVEVPENFGGDTNHLNGVQVFAKDDNAEKWRVQYGAWVNINQTGGKYVATLSPTTEQILGGYTEYGFDPARIRIIGVKFAIGQSSLATYDGPLYINKVIIEPPLNFSSPPPLSQSTPLPLFNSADKYDVRSDGFYLNDRKWFVVGGNWRILEYGQNFGATAWFPTGNGISKHPNYVEHNFDYFRRAGIKVVRVGLLTDGRTMFDEDGHVTGFDPIFRNDVKTFLDLAREAGIKVEFTIFDYLIAGKGQNVNGVWLRGRSQIITNETLREEFTDEFLIPFLNEFGNHSALMAFDVINEPEWVISKVYGGGWEDYDDIGTKPDESVPGPKMAAFINKTITAIQNHTSRKLATVGISCAFIPLMYNLTIDYFADYFALHHYPWMEEIENYLPLLPTGKPWSLEEFPTKATPLNMSEYLNLAKNAKGTGGLLWNLRPETDNSTLPWSERDSKLLELRDWVRKNLGALEFSLSPNPALIGQTVVLLGNLTDGLGQGLNNTQVIVQVNGVFAATLPTNASGWFTASAKVNSPGTYAINVTYAGNATYNPSWHNETLSVYQTMDTKIPFTLTPSPAKVGQTVTLKGNLTTVFGNPIGNAPLELWAKIGAGSWQYMAALSTNSTGWFQASGKVWSAGIYQVAVVYRGTSQYNMSYKIEILVVNP